MIRLSQNFIRMLVLLSYKFCVKISFVAQTEVAILSYNEKVLVHDRGRNFYTIIPKLSKIVVNTFFKFFGPSVLCYFNVIFAFTKFCDGK